MDSYGAQVAIFQRVSSLEDIVRRSESSMVHVLTRLRDVELALTSIHRMTEKSQPEIAFLAEEVGMVKRRVDVVDSTWRTSITDLVANVQAEFRKPPQPTPGELHLAQSVQTLRQELSETQQFLRRISEQSQADNAELHQLANSSRWSAEQIQILAQQQKEIIEVSDKRSTQAMSELRTFAAEVERNALSFRAMFENGVRAMHGDVSGKLESETRQREALQADVQLALSKLRDEIVRGLSLASTNIRSNEDSHSALEIVLRAEVKSRVQKTDDISRTVDELAGHFKRDSTNAVKLLKEIDSDVGSAITSTQQSQQDTRSLVDQLFKGQKELRVAIELLATSSAINRSGSAAAADINTPRSVRKRSEQTARRAA